MADKQRERVAELLSDLMAAGAEVKDSKKGSALTKEALTSKPMGDWEAWVTWTKSF
ncbi:hypothetical protein HJB56_09820 [Rhizobium lentis]|uniref:hypothetical protein n=1 Tax=Rhizobium lentis TaxID=1138194 RepID=UPI001C83EC42|nr:hypothetical protein [Rhizobium lentis]MBX5083058.1 hypothetical protein [Rhizobium lentis]MBX5095801.1 hypothetical protein [Rhizobium lentis]MBX5120351.1 hypothetical protein [Rhizobium lentis]